MRAAEAGVVIGGYELVRRIGRGGMAEVWVAHKPLGKRGSKFVALKLIADHFVGDERYARMFRAEAELAATLSHANIVQVFDEGQQDGRSYLVMEWVDGLNLLKLGDVLSLLDDNERRFRVIAYIIGQLLHALDYAHSITSVDGSPLGVVHRDVSPQNVLVSNHGEVKLTDFGVAFHNFEESSGIHVKGKVRYMAPEQIRGETRRATVDLFAVGALLHELLDGKKFRGELEDGQELFGAVLSGHVRALERPVPPPLECLRQALLEPDPTRRVRTAKDALAMLGRYPGYGDARGELSKLCGSLTGVLRPRAGPGQPSKVEAIEQEPQARALITGHTQFVSPLAPSPGMHGWAGHQPVGSMVFPTTVVRSGGTQVLEPIVRSEPTGQSEPTLWSSTGSDSGTEQELLAPAVAGDGTDTSRSSPRATIAADSVSIVLTRRSAVAAVGLGLLMMAALSFVTTWLMFVGKRADATPQASPAAGNDKSEKHEGGTLEAPAGQGASVLTASTKLEQADQMPADEGPHDEGPGNEDPEPTAAAQAQPTATAKKPRKPKEAAGKALVKVTSSSGLEKAQVRVGSKVLLVDDRREHEITAGRKTIRWRRSGSEPWQSSKSQHFAANKRFVVFIGKHGPHIRSN